MPPSGFSQKAINGLLEFVKANYQATLRPYDAQVTKQSESDFLRETVGALEQRVKQMMEQSPLRIGEEGIRGITTFVTSCYEDLVHEIYAGHDKRNRPIVDGKAIQRELDQIGAYLKDFKI